MQVAEFRCKRYFKCKAVIIFTFCMGNVENGCFGTDEKVVFENGIKGGLFHDLGVCFVEKGRDEKEFTISSS